MIFKPICLQLVNMTSAKSSRRHNDVIAVESAVYDWQLKAYDCEMDLLKEQGKLERYRLDHYKQLQEGDCLTSGTYRNL